ncbi:hypothetical protein [Sphingomonas sp.]|uniref:hypothetical protein n=1 Tax=Sphingomonas sp. TaxID=28214 RepID=UPI003B00998B
MPNVQDVIDSIPPDAWPLIDTLFKITVVVTLVWLFLALVAWWRRHAYNLTIASTASRSRNAQPDFLHVDQKARAAAIERGEAHEDDLDTRERAEAAALAAAKHPVTIGERLASAAAFLMSVFTLLTVLIGAVGQVGSMSATFKQLSSTEKMQKIITDHWIAALMAVLVIAWHVYKFLHERKWKGA